MSSTPSISGAYHQIVDWYQHWQAAEQAQPIQLLITNGAPDEAADAPKETDPTTQTIDVIA